MTNTDTGSVALHDNLMWVMSGNIDRFTGFISERLNKR